MKKLLKSLLVSALVAVLMCGVMVTAQAANENMEDVSNPDEPTPGNGNGNNNHGGGGGGGTTGGNNNNNDHPEDMEHIHIWLFKEFEWIIEQEYSWLDRTVVSVIAKYECNQCGEKDEVVAMVTGDKYMVTASIAGVDSLDYEDHSETIELNHEYVFDHFDWDMTDYTAEAVCFCKECGKEYREKASMYYSWDTAIATYFDIYHVKHEEVINPDFGDFEPYGWDFNKIYEFDGFRWEKVGFNKYKAYAKYKRGVMGCGVLYWLDPVEVEAVVTVTLSTLAYKEYTAKLASWQTPDGVERTETKRYSADRPPMPPVGPRTRIDDSVIAPPKEMKPANP